VAYVLNPGQMVQAWNILVVGCGGTGGFVAEGLCRLLTGTNVPLILIDHDRVEPHNLLRQNFYPGEVGKFKSQALAERLSRQFGRSISFCVYPYDAGLIGHEFGGGMYKLMSQGIIIGCVDNPGARKSIAKGVIHSNWWIDAGNGRDSGQVLIGNTSAVGSLSRSFDEEKHQVDRLPIPSLQLPSLLAPVTKELNPRRDCAEAVAAEEQSPVINQAMATLVLQFVYRFLTKKLTWMGAYIDLEAGTLQAVSADPTTVARLCGVKVDTLLTRSNKKGGFNATRRSRKHPGNRRRDTGD